MSAPLTPERLTGMERVRVLWEMRCLHESGVAPVRCEDCLAEAFDVLEQETRLVERARGTALALMIAQRLMGRGHFYECQNGKRGGPPDDHSNPTGARCSNVCIDLRAALAAYEAAQ